MGEIGIGSGSERNASTPRGGELDFYATLAPIYDAVFPLSPALANCVDRLLAAVPQRTLLDLGSGGGQLAVHAARQTTRVVAVDLHPDMVAAGAQLAKRQGVPVIWRQGDLVSVSRTIGERFGVVACVGNTMLHLPSMEIITDGLRALASSLRPGGRLLVQTINVDHCLIAGALEPPVKRVMTPAGEVIFRRRYRPNDAGGINFDTELERGGQCARFSVEMVRLTAQQLHELACQAGLKDVRLYGDYAGAAWSKQAPATILQASGRSH